MSDPFTRWKQSQEPSPTFVDEIGNDSNPFDRWRATNVPTASSFFDIVEPSSYGTSLTLSADSRRADRAARTQLRHMQREFRQVGKLGDFNKYVENKGKIGVLGALDAAMTNVVDPTFDLLNVGIYPTRGAALEYMRTGSSWEAFKQAGIELANALPGVELENARRTTGVDLLQEMGMDKWSAAVAGLAMDYYLDPINLIPGGFLLKSATKGARGVSAATPETLKKGLKFLFMPNREVSSVGEAGEAVLKLHEEATTLAQNDIVKIQDRVSQMVAWMNPYERTLFGAWHDQSKKFEEVLDSMVQLGYVDAKRVPMLKVHQRIVKNFTDEVFKGLHEQGLIDELMFRDAYVHGMAPVDPLKLQTWEKMGRRRTQGAVGSGGDLLPAGKKLPASFSRRTENQEERFAKAMAGDLRYATESDIHVVLNKVGVDYVRWTTWKKFQEAVLNDGRVAARVVEGDSKLFNNGKKWGAFKEDIQKQFPGFDVLEVKRKTHTEEKKVVDEITGAFVLPAPIVRFVSRGDAALRSTDDLDKMFRWMDEYTSIWRGWATFSPGYHARNATTNMFLNWIYGVGTGYDIRQILKDGKWPLPGDFALRHLQAFKLQMLTQGAGRMPRASKLAVDNIAQRIGYKGFEEVKLPTIKDSTGRTLSAQEIVREGESYGVPSLVTKFDVTNPDVERKIWGELEGEIATEGLDETTAFAVNVGRGEKLPWSQRVKKAMGDNSLLRLHHSFAQIVDNNARWALFLDRRMKGVGAAEAAYAVKTGHFGVQNMSVVEQKGLRVLYPFWAWTRFAVPKMIFSILENPGRFSKVPKLKNSIESLTNHWGELPTPDYYDEVQSIQLPWVRKNRPMFLQLDTPVKDLNSVNYRSVMSSLHPFVTGIMESVPRSGYSIFMDAPMESFPGEEIPELPGVQKRVAQLVGTALPPAGTAIRAAIANNRGELSEFGISYLTGVKLRALDVHRVLRAQTYWRRKLAIEFKKQLKQEGTMR